MLTEPLSLGLAVAWVLVPSADICPLQHCSYFTAIASRIVLVLQLCSGLQILLQNGDNFFWLYVALYISPLLWPGRVALRRISLNYKRISQIEKYIFPNWSIYQAVMTRPRWDVFLWIANLFKLKNVFFQIENIFVQKCNQIYSCDRVAADRLIKL